MNKLYTHPENINFIEKEFIDFRKNLDDQLFSIFQEEEMDSIVKAMFTCVYNNSMEFFDEQMLENMPNFITVLITKYPNLITSYSDVSSIPANEDNETSIYDHIFNSFYELQINDSIKEGVALGVFEEKEGTVDLTPWYTL